MDFCPFGACIVCYVSECCCGLLKDMDTAASGRALSRGIRFGVSPRIAEGYGHLPPRGAHCQEGYVSGCRCGLPELWDFSIFGARGTQKFRSCASFLSFVGVCLGLGTYALQGTDTAVYSSMRCDALKTFWERLHNIEDKYNRSDNALYRCRLGKRRFCKVRITKPRVNCS